MNMVDSHPRPHVGPTAATPRHVYVVDDDPLLLESVAPWLDRARFVVTALADAREAFRMIPLLPPGCVLLGVHMRGVDGFPFLETAQGRLAAHPVIVMADDGDADRVIGALKLGAVDFLEKPIRETDLIVRLERTLDGLSQLLDDARQRERAVVLVAALSPREADVLAGLLAGLSNKAVAQLLDISPRTVEMHRANMMRRLAVQSLSEALKIAIAAGMAPAVRPDERG